MTRRAVVYVRTSSETQGEKSNLAFISLLTAVFKIIQSHKTLQFCIKIKKGFQ